MADDSYSLVVAIDFGTTFSGYAFSFKHEPEKVYMNKDWGSEMGHSSYKTPTAVLTGPNNEFVAFGYEAEKEFAFKEDKSDLNLFRNFKMVLYNDKLGKETTISSTSGKQCLAMNIFVMAIKFLKGHLMVEIQKQDIGAVDKDLIKWVITLPAIWSEGAKHFMREACFQAGLVAEISSPRLTIALEPEAAATFCQKRDISNFISNSKEKGGKNVSFEVGDQYLVIDAGGGTVDITAHVIIAERKVKELIPPSGGPWGGANTDKKFENLFDQIFGEDFMTSYKTKFGSDWLQIMINFENSKKGFSKDIRINLTWNFGMQFQSFTGEGIDKRINKMSQKLKIGFQNGMLIILKECADWLFRDVITSLRKHTSELLLRHELQKVKYILLVGGFAQCLLLQQEIIENFSPKYTVLIPYDSQLAVVQGAVLYGHYPDTITTRIARFSYGYSMSTPFNPDIHRQKNMILINGKPYCNNIFGKIVTIGEEIEMGSKFSVSLGVTDESYKDGFCTMEIYSSTISHPRYTSGYTVTKLWELKVYHKKDTMENTGTIMEFEFGGTEIYISARSKTGGEAVKTSVHFCSD